VPEKVDYGVRVLLGSDGIYELYLQPSDVSHAIWPSNIYVCKLDPYSELRVSNTKPHVKNKLKTFTVTDI